MPQSPRLDPRVKIVQAEAMFAPRDLADYLRVDLSMIREFRARGRIPPPDLYISNRPRWRPETVAAIVATRRI